jgi:hypothetical protein
VIGKADHNFYQTHPAGSLSKPSHIPFKALSPGLNRTLWVNTSLATPASVNPLKDQIGDPDKQTFNSVNDLKSRWEYGAVKDSLSKPRPPKGGLCPDLMLFFFFVGWLVSIFQILVFIHSFISISFVYFVKRSLFFFTFLLLYLSLELPKLMKKFSLFSFLLEYVVCSPFFQFFDYFTHILIFKLIRISCSKMGCNSPRLTNGQQSSPAALGLVKTNEAKSQ